MEKNNWKEYKRSLLGFFTLDFAFCFQFLLFIYWQEVGVVPKDVSYFLSFILIFPSVIALTGIIIILSYDIFNQKEIQRLRNKIRLIDKVIDLKKKGIIP